MQAKEIIFSSSEETEEVERLIEKNYGCRVGLRQFAVAIERDDVRVVSKNISDLFGELRIDSFGMHVCRLKPNGRIQPSIEGSQMIGKSATKNIAVLDDGNVGKFIQGFDADVAEKINCEDGSFVLVKNRDDFLGSAKLSGNRVENMTPKNRRTVFTTGRLT